jgi:SAM-dependent methyltransferase
MSTKVQASFEILQALKHRSGIGKHLLRKLPFALRGLLYARGWDAPAPAPPPRTDGPHVPNPLRAHFQAHREGPGIWKWDHYFDIYHRHFERFRGREVHVLEIGIYSGGSLGLWKDYFGPRCRVYGVDIEPACTQYEGDRVRVFTGDQADRDFWRRFRAEVPDLDIVIDDGGHETEQQVATLEELLPHVRPGGVYLCEDVTHRFNGFASYAYGLIDSLNAFDGAAWTYHPDGTRAAATAPATRFQGVIRSIHSYPFVTVVEKADAPVASFVAPRHGTQWQPFL